jgi:hypothetical protein
VRNALVYVLQNRLKHRARLGSDASRRWVCEPSPGYAGSIVETDSSRGPLDALSSAAWFRGFASSLPVGFRSIGPPCVVPAKTWLLTVGYLRYGRIRIGGSAKELIVFRGTGGAKRGSRLWTSRCQRKCAWACHRRSSSRVIGRACVGVETRARRDRYCNIGTRTARNQGRYAAWRVVDRAVVTSGRDFPARARSSLTTVPGACSPSDPRDARRQPSAGRLTIHCRHSPPDGGTSWPGHGASRWSARTTAVLTIPLRALNRVIHAAQVWITQGNSEPNPSRTNAEERARYSARLQGGDRRFDKAASTLHDV